VDNIVNGGLRGLEVDGYTFSELAARHPKADRAYEEIKAASFKAPRKESMSSSKGTLFIGGPKHGQREVVRSDYRDAVRVAHFNTPNAVRGEFGYEPIVPAMSTTVYTLEKVGVANPLGGGRSLRVFRHESLSRETAAQAALDIVFYEAGGTV
jgi:hypothetical protein